MVSIARRLTRFLPDAPRKRYNVFAGTNTYREWWQGFRQWAAGGPYDDGPIIGEYEREFAQCCGARHAISFGSGRMALYAILESLNVGPGDEVIIPAFTCVVVPNAIMYRGARPIYVDIEQHTFNIDVDGVEAAISPRTKALYAQHTFGVPCRVERLRQIGHKHGLPIIEDGAHALGARYNGQAVGGLTEVGFFSSDHSKVINTHLGGMAVTDDARLAERLRHLQAAAPFLDDSTTRRLIRSFLLEFLCFRPSLLWLGRIVHAALARMGALFFFNDELSTSKPTSYPYPCRLSSAQALLGLSQLRNLAANLSHRRDIARWLENRIGWYGLTDEQINDGTWLRYSFLVSDRQAFEDAFRYRMDLGVWFTTVLGERSRDFDAVGYAQGSCPTAEYVARHIVNFPTHLQIPLERIQLDVEDQWERVRQNLTDRPRYAQDVSNRLAEHPVR